MKDISPETLGRMADLVHEAGMLRHTQRTGWAFLGTNSENVAEHSFRTALLGWMLAKMAGADAARISQICLFHDLHEARTGDFNYVYHRYDTSRARDALADGLRGTGFEDCVLELFDEFEDNASIEAKLANDADQIDLIANLAVELHKGNEFAREWLDSALKRLETPEGRALAEAVLRVDPNRWWYGQVDKDWWIHHCDPKAHKARGRSGRDTPLAERDRCENQAGD